MKKVAFITFVLSVFFPIFSQSQGLRSLDPEKVVGFTRCAMCHVNEVRAWKNTHHHKTFADLHKRPKAKSIAKAMGLSGSIKRKGECRNCHYVLQGAEKKAISGIACESCHGPARDWINVHNAFIPKPERNKKVDAAGMIRPARTYHVAENCYQCHTIPNEKLVNEGGHPSQSPGFNLVSWTQGEIRHNFLSGGGQNKKVSQEKKRILYVVGQGLEFEYGLRGFALATKKKAYSLKMSKKMRNSQKQLIKLYKLTNIPEIAKMKNAVKGVTIKLSNEDAFIAAAEKVKAANLEFVAKYNGSESELAKIDSMIPGPSDYKGTATE